ncbi:SLOG family protein [Bradyrhizobium sp. USDA 4508]
MRVLVCGGRKYRDRNAVFRTLDMRHAATPISVILHGGATGADAMAAEWAAVNGVEALEYLADWKKLGPQAGPKRNADMIKYGQPDLVLAFPGNAGTADMVEKAERAGIAFELIE